MNKEKEEILMNNAKEYYQSGIDDLKKERNNSALILFFKSLVALCDLFLLQKTGKSPSSHTNRFRILKENYIEVYDLLDKNFPYYQGSYVKSMTKEIAEVIKEDAKTMAKKTQVELF